MKFLFVLIAFAVCSASAQQFFNNKCRDRPVFENFNVQKYASHRWYEVARFNASFETGCECSQATYTLREDGSVGVENCCKRNGSPYCAHGHATLEDANKSPLEAKLKVSFDEPLQPSNRTNYIVLSTDYDNYSIVYYCGDIPGDKSIEFLWVLSSKPQGFDEAVKPTVDDLVEKYFETKLLYVVDQSEEFCSPRQY